MLHRWNKAKQGFDCEIHWALILALDPNWQLAKCKDVCVCPAMDCQPVQGVSCLPLTERAVMPSMSQSVSASTIGRRLYHSGQHPCRWLPLTPCQSRQRLHWCLARQSWSNDFCVLKITNKSVCGGTTVSTKINSLLSRHRSRRPGVTPPPSLPSNLQELCANIQMHGMNYHSTPIGTSTTACWDVWQVALANIVAKCHTERHCMCGLKNVAHTV